MIIKINIGRIGDIDIHIQSVLLACYFDPFALSLTRISIDIFDK